MEQLICVALYIADKGYLVIPHGHLEISDYGDHYHMSVYYEASILLYLTSKPSTLVLIFRLTIALSQAG